jgi:ABC-2 type transport system ATP-binding protein
MNEYVIETQALTKRYGKLTAVEELSISVPIGVVAGFVGPNGSGKTTTMSMLLGLVTPSDGTAKVLGEPITQPEAYLAQVGALIEGPAFYPGLSGRENLALVATVAGHDTGQIPEMLELVGLADRGDDRFGSYSMGMKQRLGIAAALLGEPALLILDEPTNGLDPAGIREMRELIRRLADGGRTVFVSSHVLAELEQVCDYFVIIDGGSLVFQGPASKLLAGAVRGVSVAAERAEDMQRLQGALNDMGYALHAANGGLMVEGNGTDPRVLAAEISRIAIANDVVLVELKQERKNLEEMYLSMVKGGN